MSDETENGEEKSNLHYGIWDYGRSPSSFNASSGDLSDLRKEMIRFALEYPIRDIRTYAGYKGDMLVMFTATDFDLITMLKNHAEALGMETAVKKKSDIRLHELYCITPDEEVYALKGE